jgi:3-(3-hydroxy-phenyl)propionate hydroxylase
MTDRANGHESVVVVGAGPTGLSAALALRARDVPVTVLEADPADRERPGSRAIYVHGATLRILERLKPGLGQQLADDGLVWPTRRTYWRGREVFSRTYDDVREHDGLPHFISHPQVHTEDALLAACRDVDVDIHWDAPVETVDSTPDGVTVETEAGETWEAPYVVGADGAESATRPEIGAEFSGDRSENSFVITDVAEFEDDPRPPERIFHYDHPEIGRNVLLVPFSGGWRVDLQCKVSDDPEAWNDEAEVADWVAKSLGERYRDRVEWISTYQFLQVTADRFIDDHRRVLLAGEAAHLFPPFGARGMNSGIADADVAGAAVADALEADDEEAARGAVEAYAEEREAAAEWNLNASKEALDHLRGNGLLTDVKKWAAAQVAPFYEPAGEWLDVAPYGPRGGPPSSDRGKY